MVAMAYVDRFLCLVFLACAAASHSDILNISTIADTETEDYDDNYYYDALTDLITVSSALADEDLPSDYGDYTTMQENSTDEAPVDDDAHLTLSYSNPIRLISPGYPSSYPDNITLMWKLSKGDGFGIEINVTDVDISLEESDHLSIIPGDGENAESLIFTGYLKEIKKYRIMDYDSLTVQFVSNHKTNESENTHRGFDISIKHIGLIVDSNGTEVDEGPDWTQQPPENLTIYLTGMTPSQFVGISEQFRKLILVDMAIQYINEMKIIVAEDIEIENTVKYNLVGACSIHWPNTESCISINFAVPVFYDDITKEYEMSQASLREMWNENIQNYIQQLALLKLQVYNRPNDDLILIVWIAVSFGVILGMIVLIYCVWRFNCFDEYIRMSRFTDTDSEVSKKKSDVSLYPTPHQTIPPLFGMDDQFWMDDSMPPKYDDPYLDPDFAPGPKSTSNSSRGHSNRSFVHDDNLFFELDSDEEIIMSLPDQDPQKTRVRAPKESSF